MEATAWSEIVAGLNEADVEVCVAAASRLHAEADVDDIPKLLELLESDNFFIREAAAWPLAELAGPAVLTDLLAAYQRGFDEGHDNDGFSAALLEVPALFPEEAKSCLKRIAAAAGEPMRGHALWMLGFIDGEARQ
jgi:hypothetical protein